MKAVKVFIYHEKDGSYSCCMDDKANLPYGLIGEGNTVDEAIAEWNSCYEAMRTNFESRGDKFVEAKFEYVFDLVSMLEYYKGCFTYASLSKITGVSAAQLSQYMSGYRNPSPKTTLKIQTALRAFGEKLSQIQLV